MVLPPASSAPRCASASTPCARPLVTTTPRAARSPASRWAMRAPAGVARRLPTIRDLGSGQHAGGRRAGTAPPGRPGSPAAAAAFPGPGAPMTRAPRAWRHARSRSVRDPCRACTRGAAGLRAALRAEGFVRRRSRTVSWLRASASRVRSRSVRSASMRRPHSPQRHRGGGIIPAAPAGDRGGGPASGTRALSWSWYRMFSPEHGWARLETIFSSHFQSVI